MAVMLQIQFDFESDDPENVFDAGHSKRLSDKLPGLEWAILTYNKEEKTGAGFYLYENEEDAQLRAKRAVPHLEAKEGISNVTAHIYTVLGETPKFVKDEPAE